VVRVRLLAEVLLDRRFRIAGTPERDAEGARRTPVGYEVYAHKSKRNRVILVPVPRIVVPLERNHLRKLIVTLALALLVPTVAAPTSPRPQSGRFSGYVAVKKVNGFSDVVTFVVRPKSLMNFSFGTLGCFGYGNFPAGVDPFSTSLASIGTVPMTAA